MGGGEGVRIFHLFPVSYIPTVLHLALIQDRVALPSQQLEPHPGVRWPNKDFDRLRKCSLADPTKEMEENAMGTGGSRRGEDGKNGTCTSTPTQTNTHWKGVPNSWLTAAAAIIKHPLRVVWSAVHTYQHTRTHIYSSHCEPWTSWLKWQWGFFFFIGNEYTGGGGGGSGGGGGCGGGGSSDVRSWGSVINHQQGSKKPPLFFSSSFFFFLLSEVASKQHVGSQGHPPQMSRGQVAHKPHCLVDQASHAWHQQAQFSLVYCQTKGEQITMVSKGREHNMWVEPHDHSYSSAVRELRYYFHTPKMAVTVTDEEVNFSPEKRGVYVLVTCQSDRCRIWFCHQ